MEDLLKLVNSVQGISDPWQRSLIIASSLSSHGVRIPEGVGWDNLSSYTVQPGDTWERISDHELSDSSLWPLLFLLNAERSLPDGTPSPGEKILLPSVTR